MPSRAFRRAMSRFRVTSMPYGILPEEGDLPRWTDRYGEGVDFKVENYPQGTPEQDQVRDTLTNAIMKGPGAVAQVEGEWAFIPEFGTGSTLQPIDPSDPRFEQVVHLPDYWTDFAVGAS